MAGLRRDLGPWELTAVAASMMLGTGIFFGPSFTAQQFPDAAPVLLLWTAGGLVALCGAWVFGRLGAMFPLSGGPYVYVREAYGPLPAFLFAWTSFTVIAPTSLAVIANVFARHAAQLSVLGPTGIALVALWGLTAATFANYVGVKSGGRTQDALTGLKVVLVVLLIGLLFLGNQAPPAPASPGAGGLSLAFVGVLFAVGGWEYAVLASEEVRDPRRTIPRALLLGTLVVVLLYVLVVAGYLEVLGADGVAGAEALAPEAAARALPGSERFVALAVAISALGTLNAIVLLGPRATFAVARDGYAPAWVARVSPRWGTPTAALLLQAALATAYFLSGTFATVAAYTVMGTGIFIVLSGAALRRLRSRAEGTRGGRLEDAAAALVVTVYAAFLGFWLFEKTLDALVGLGIVAAGIVPYVLFRRARPRAGGPPTPL